MSVEVPSGIEVLRVERAEQVSELDGWVHDAYLEEEDVRFSAAAARAVIPFAQESGWGDRHPSMPGPVLVKTTLFAHHYEVPLTRCFLVVERALSLEVDVLWEVPDLVAAEFSDSTFRLTSDGGEGVAVRVEGLDVRLLVSGDEAGRLYREVLRWWPAEYDRRLSPPP